GRQHADRFGGQQRAGARDGGLAGGCGGHRLRVYDTHRARMSNGPVNVVVLPTPEAVCLRAAEIVAELLAAKPDAALALPAGNTPRPVYAELARRHREEGLSFTGATVFALDEYAGIAPDHRASFARFLNGELYRRVDLPAGHAHIPDAMAA